MAARKFFRVNDIVTVHNFSYDSGPRVRGRVICTNRVTKYDESIVVLAEVKGVEMISTFKPDGTRWLSGNNSHITLGWKEDPPSNGDAA